LNKQLYPSTVQVSTLDDVVHKSKIKVTVCKTQT